MDPAKKKWLIRLKENIAITLAKNPKKRKLVQSFSQSSGILASNLLQATGLIYGHNDEHIFCEFEEDSSWSISDHIKIGVTECLFAICLHYNEDKSKSIEENLDAAMQYIFDFYQEYTPQKLKRSLISFGKEKTLDEKLELIINNRLSNSSILQKKFWKGSIFNTFIYLDLLYFTYWLEKNELIDLPTLEDIKVLILETIIAAIWCDGQINKENKILLYYFLSSAILSEQNMEYIQLIAVRGISINEISYSTKLPLSYKEVILKSALLCVLNDKEITTNEQDFLDELIAKLHISKETLEKNIVHTQSFIFNYFDKVTYLKNRNGFEIVSKGFMRNFSSMIKKNRSNIVKEISESKELVELLWKAKNKQLTKDEKEKVKEQITDILRTIPSFAIFMIPGGTVLLPIILKILPDELLIPSSFRN